MFENASVEFLYRLFKVYLLYFSGFFLEKELNRGLNTWSLQAWSSSDSFLFCSSSW